MIRRRNERRKEKYHKKEMVGWGEEMMGWKGGDDDWMGGRR